MKKVLGVVTTVVVLSASVFACSAPAKPAPNCFIIGEIEIDEQGTNKEYKLTVLGGFQKNDYVQVSGGTLKKCWGFWGISSNGKTVVLHTTVKGSIPLFSTWLKKQKQCIMVRGITVSLLRTETVTVNIFGQELSL